ncbi:MAG: TolC family protein [Cephaloticoccus sp.]|nr:TolC family protein [Cephaloticoccus sp.]MCF7760767.1 TolC family protein [Cephaloticoccus sp.]
MNYFLHKRILGLFGIFALGLGGVWAAETPQLAEDIFPELRQILAEAAKQSPRMLAQDLDLLMADGDLVQAKSGMLPRLGGYYQKSKTKDVREDVTGTLDSNKTYYSVSFSQPIFHWGALRNNAKAGEIRRLIADENYAEAYRILAQEIRANYLGLIMTKVGVRVSSFNRKLAEEKLAVEEERLQKKVISEGAIFQTRIDAEQARLALDTAEWYFLNAKQDFSLLTGQPQLTDAQIPNGIPGLMESKPAIDRMLAGFLAQAEPNTASARILRQQIEIDDLNYRSQKTGLRPKLNFVLGVSQDEQSYTTNLAQKYALQSQYAGLQVSWNIFDGFATRGAVTSALARKRLDERNYRVFTERLAHDARKAAKAVELAQRQLAISERLLDNAGNFLAYTKEDFKRGQASETAVNNAQANYNSLEHSANSVRRDYLLRVSEFLSLIEEAGVSKN